MRLAIYNKSNKKDEKLRISTIKAYSNKCIAK